MLARRGGDLHLARHPRQLLRRVPLFTQDSPRRVVSRNQTDLLRTRPSLQLFFPIDCVARIDISLKPDEPIAVELGRESVASLSLVFENSLFQVTGYPDVER
jgi:hypothetical protein